MKKPRGRPFPPGNKANPRGRPKLPPDVQDVRTLAKTYTRQAIEALAKIAFDTKASLPARVSALVHLLDRGHGRPTTPIEVESSTPLTAVEIVVQKWRG